MMHAHRFSRRTFATVLSALLVLPLLASGLRAAPQPPPGPQLIGSAIVLQTDLSVPYVPTGTPSPWGNHDPAYIANQRSGHYATAVGPNGNVVGNTGLGAFWWTEATGLVEIFETFGACMRCDQGGFATDVNGKGQVVGSYYPKGANGDIQDQGFGLYWHSRAYIWSQANGFVDLGVTGVPTPGGNIYNLSSAATAVNEMGQVVGWMMFPTPNSPFAVVRGFLWTPHVANGTTGTITDLGQLGGYPGGREGSQAYGINNNGTVVGYSAVNVNGQHAYSHAFVWTPTTPNATTGTLQDLGALGVGLQSYPGNRNGGVAAKPINASGQVAGTSAYFVDPYGNPKRAPFLWTPPGPMQDLGTTLINPVAGAQITDSQVYTISTQGRVVGRNGFSDGTWRGFVYTPGVGMESLPPNTFAVGVTDTGLVTGMTGILATAWQNGQTLNLNQANWQWSEIYSMNSTGLAAGYSYSNTGAFRATVWTLDGGPGDDVAVACTAGTYSATGNAPCDAAEAGYFVPTAGATAQTACPVGTYSSVTGAETCQDAPAGSYVSTVAAASALLCDAGTYSATAGSASCTPAGAGFFVALIGSTAQTACPAGYGSDGGATECYLLDGDGDGVGDATDAFPNSNRAPLVSVGTCNTGVTNKLLPNGATFNDLLGAAQAASGGNHGKWVSAVTALSGGWKNAGLITGQEHGKIVSCVAQQKSKGGQ